MLTGGHYEFTGRKVIIKGNSQRDAAKELGHFRKTIANALKLRIPPSHRLGKSRPRPAIESVSQVIDAWLERNRETRHKQKKTAMRICGRLRDGILFGRPCNARAGPALWAHNSSATGIVHAFSLQ